MVVLGVSQAALQGFYFRVADWWEGRVGAVLPPSPSHSAVLTGAAISNSLMVLLQRFWVPCAWLGNSLCQEK